MLLPVLPSSLSPHKSTQQGFTLVETLLYLTLFGMIMTNLAILGFALMKHSGSSTRNNGNLMEARFIRDKINYLISTHRVMNSGNEDPAILKISDGAVNSNVEQTNGQLMIRDESGKLTSLSNPAYKVTSLTFKLLNQDQMLIEFQLDEQSYAFHQQLWTNPQ